MEHIVSFVCPLSYLLSQSYLVEWTHSCREQDDVELEARLPFLLTLLWGYQNDLEFFAGSWSELQMKIECLDVSLGHLMAKNRIWVVLAFLAIPSLIAQPSC